MSNDERKQKKNNEEKKNERDRNPRETTSSQDVVTETYQNALSSSRTKRGETGVIYDQRMVEHRCLWDSTFPDRPERFTRVLERCDELQLLNRCRPLTPRLATREEILLKHSQEHYDLLKSTDGEMNEEKLEDLSSNYAAVYIHPSTFQLSKLAVGSTIELVDNILTNQVQNGMAIIRPPGHHAMETEFNGSCLFNNVAIAAQHAIDKHKIERVLIVDYDVHHGQGTQRHFYDDPRVLYFSAHRFEYGQCFPNLPESDYDAIGEGKGEGFNFNVPLNKVGMTNADYLAIWQQLLIPVAAEFKPELIMVSAGYDAAIGCPLGEMEISPAGYTHLISPLMALANGKMAVVLEGGYCLDSLAEGAALTLRTLLGDPCPLMDPLSEPCKSVQESILNCTQTHKPYWTCLRVHEEYDMKDLNDMNPQPELHKVVKKFIGMDGFPPKRWPTRKFYPFHDDKTFNEFAERLRRLRMTTNLSVAPKRVCYAYDSSKGHLDCPELTKIDDIFDEYNLKNRMHILESSKAVIDGVLNGEYQKGMCVALLPGRQTDEGHSRGFCSNVASAAKYAINNHDLERILIVDWDIYHDSNMPRMFESTKKVLYISLHRFDHGRFLPNSSDGNYDVVGGGLREGFNVNIPWNEHEMGDADYITAFQRIIMPIAYELNPELVLVSAGFGACVGGPKSSYNVSPEAYGYFTHWLSSLANGKIILYPAEGHVVDSSLHGIAMCAKALLGDPLPMLQKAGNPSTSCIETIQNVLSVQQKYWKSLKFNQKLPSISSSTTTSADPLPSDTVLKELTDCPHLPLLDTTKVPEVIDSTALCVSCNSALENRICLNCFSVYCSRYMQEHMFHHHLETGHPLALNFRNLSIWCYKCDAYVDNAILNKYKNAVYKN